MPLFLLYVRYIKIHISTWSGFRWEFPQMKTKSLALWSKTNKIKCTDYIKEGQAGWIKWLLHHKAQTASKCVTACVCCVTVEREQWAAAGDDDYMLCRLGIVIQCILIHSRRYRAGTKLHEIGDTMLNWVADTSHKESMLTNPPISYDLCIGVPITCLLTVMLVLDR